MKSLLYLCICLVSLSAFSQNWERIGSGMNKEVRALYADSNDNKLYVGGAFKHADDKEVNGLTVWDGTSFDSLGSGASNCLNSCGPVLSISKFGSDVFICGNLNETGGTPVNGIAKWDGQSWHSVLNGINGVGKSLEVIGNKLYVGGAFDSAGTIQAEGISLWDGDTWSGVDNFPNNNPGFFVDIGNIQEYNGEVYVAGNFVGGSGISPDIARWDGSQWKSVENGILGLNSWVNDLVVYQEELYVAGFFSKEDGNSSTGIMKWDGENWLDAGGGINEGAQIFKMAVYNNYLYACGSFSSTGGISAKYIARWDGEEWCGLGSDFNNTILTMAVYNNELYVGGGFTNIDGENINRIAKWAGGNFVDTCGSLTGVDESPFTDINVRISPNPATNILNLQTTQNGRVDYFIYDITGRQLQTGNFISNTKVDVSAYANGVYFLTVLQEKTKATVKVVIQH